MDKLLQLLGLAMRARKVVTGTDAVLRAIRSGEAKMVLLAEDASPGAVKKVRDKCTYYSVPVIRYGTRKALGNAVGKPERVVVAVTDQGFARTMRKWVRVSDGGDEFDENARLRICEKNEYEQQGSAHHPQTDEHGSQQPHECDER
jgi:ribosomal protein L7Ae-like RNA K-turn-binding protein